MTTAVLFMRDGRFISILSDVGFNRFSLQSTFKIPSSSGHRNTDPMKARFILLIILALLCSISAIAQQAYHRSKARHFKSRYRDQIAYYNDACDLLRQKKYALPKSTIRSKASTVKYKPMAEFEPPGTLRTARLTPQALPAPEPAPALVTDTDEQKNSIEDRVLAENKLPVPTSEKHAEIRQKVREMLSEMKDGKPIDLPPLYFHFNRDELAIVNTEPFLYAVEFALHGRHILIEGHTDTQGSDQYNVQLSIKRVERIRKMMHDMGVPDDLISVVGYGEEQASVASSGRPVDHQLHRRVDFKVF